MKGDELKTWRHQRNWTLDQTARFLGTTRTSVHRWEVGMHAVPQTIAILTHLLAEIRNIRSVENFLFNTLDT
jgi:transcriptional regulator with XRE-family HTH domain